MCDDSTQAETYDKLGDELQEKGEFEEAAIAFSRASQLNPEVSWYFHKLGDALLKQEKWFEAADAYRRAIELKSDFSWSYHNLGYAYQQQQQWHQSVTAYRQAIELNPDFAWSYYNLGDGLTKIQAWDEAALVYFQAVMLDPNLPEIYYKLGNSLRQYWQLSSQGNLNLDSQNSGLDNTLLEFASNDDQIYLHLGNCLTKENQLEGAIILYQKALEIKPNDTEILAKLEQVLTQKNELDRKIESCRKSVLENPNSCWSYYNLGVALTRQSQGEEAANQFLHILELYPDFHWWFYYNIWEVLTKQGKLEEAVSLCRHAIANQPEAFWPYLNLGEALSRQGKFDEAIVYYQAASRQQTLKLLPDLSQQNSNLIPVEFPNFIIIGSQRCGTTSLYSYLTQHPQILSPIKKEVDFWSWHFNRGINWYLSHFPPLPQGQHFVTGEASPSYLDFSDTPSRIFSIFPQVKLIVLLRNPVDRAISQYHRWVSLNWEHRSFEAAINDELERLKNNPDHIIGEEPGNYLSRGRYVEFLKKWLEFFPREQLLIVKSEDFYGDTALVMKQILEFLGLPEYYLPEYANSNPGIYSSVNESMRSWINDYFLPYNQQLEEFLGIKFDWE